jgi:hypothetical protein
MKSFIFAVLFDILQVCPLFAAKILKYIMLGLCGVARVAQFYRCRGVCAPDQHDECFTYVCFRFTERRAYEMEVKAGESFMDAFKDCIFKVLPEQEVRRIVCGYYFR